MKKINILFNNRFHYPDPFIKGEVGSGDNKIKISIIKSEFDLVENVPFIYYVCVGSGLKRYLGLKESHEDKKVIGFLENTSNKIKKLINDGNGYILCSYMQEGHVEMEAYKNLHNYLLRHKIDASRVIFLSSNLNGHLQYKNFCKKFKVLTENKLHILQSNHMFESMIEVCRSYELGDIQVPPEVENNSDLTVGINSIEDIDLNFLRPKYFLCMNRNMGRGYRIAILSLMLENNLFDKGLVSMGPLRTKSNFPLGWEPDDNWWIKDTLLKNKIWEIQKKLKKLQPLQIEDEFVWKTDGLWPGFDFKETYSKVYFDVVTESCYATESIYCSEKTYKPISQLLPFILLGPPGILKKVKEQGFKTFSPFIDESYDGIEDHGDRLLKVFGEVKRLCELPKEELKTWYSDIFDDLVFNQKHLLSSKLVDHENIYNIIWGMLN